jgi:hypothetical protein
LPVRPSGSDEDDYMGEQFMRWFLARESIGGG